MIAIGSTARLDVVARYRAWPRTTGHPREPAAPARPTPWYSCIVSIMSSISLLDRRALDICAVDGTGLGAKHRVAHVRHFQNRHDLRNYTGRLVTVRRDMQDLHPHDESHAYRFCPRCGARPRTTLAEANRARPPGVPAVRLRVLHRSENCRRDDHPDRRRANRARATRHRAGLRQVGVPWRLRRPGRTAAGWRHCAKRGRNAASTCGSTV